ncbi:MAG: hypothetical protein FIB06_01490 [Betaproteobacteria bacterium]|nr:hypothetical protein [Betaproteobacteria bacterium]
MFLKKCPHCAATVDIRRLHKVPCSAPLRWHDFTPAAQTACPACAGLVKLTAEKSPALLVGFAALIGVALAAVVFPVVGRWIAQFPGGIYLLALAALSLGGLVLKNSALTTASSR